MPNQSPQGDVSPSFPVEQLRAQFPALRHAGEFVFFDNAAGAQVPQAVLDAVNRHLLENNVQRGGRYPQSLAVDAAISQGRRRVATFLNASRAEEVAFGMNATSFIRLISLAIAQTLTKRDVIIVTEMDHEANIATWLALERQGASIVYWRMREDGNLHLADLQGLLSERTRLVACTVASNVLGTIMDVRGIATLAHAAGAEVFLDCVHFAPHAPIDVQAFDCDYLVCSGYKIFAPHMGFMWGRYELLKALPTFREDFVPDEPPGKIEAGTFIFENVAGMDAAICYLQRLGRQVNGLSGDGSEQSFRGDLVAGLEAVRHYEQALSLHLLTALHDCGAVVYGVDQPSQVALRVPTVCFNLPGVAPARVTQTLADAGIGIRDGHLYAPRLMRHLGLDLAEGAARVSLVHYNTVDEIDRFAQVLRTLC